MISESIRAKVANATVDVLLTDGARGRGVLVKDNFILTAAHCIEFKCDGSMVLGDYFITEIETRHGRLKVTPFAVEPVHDIAALGSLDNQEFSDEAEQFEEFCRKTKPVPLCLDAFEQFQTFPVYIYTHKKTWMKGEGQDCSSYKDSPAIMVRTDEQIEGGTSGSPIVNERGQLVAIVSTFREGLPCDGLEPRPHLALPTWISLRIRRGSKFNVPTLEEIEKMKHLLSERR
jgi:hypothetical protein